MYPPPQRTHTHTRPRPTAASEFCVSRQHVTLIDSSNHSSVFACQVQNVTDTRLIGWRSGWGEGRGARNETENKILPARHPHPPPLSPPRLCSFSSSSPSSSIIFPLLSPPHLPPREIRFDSESRRAPPNDR